VEEKPLTKPFISTSFWTSSSALIASGCDQASFSPSNTAWKTSGPPMRSKRNSSHIMFVQRDCPPRENGAMPAALNLGTRSRMSPQVCGGSTPTLSNTLLL